MDSCTVNQPLTANYPLLERLRVIGEMFETVQRRMPQVIEGQVSGYGLTMIAWKALAAIGELGDEATLGAIGERIEVPASTMTGIAHRLETLAYVERRASPIDRRAAILSYTPRGREVVDTVLAQFFSDLSQAIDLMGDGELDRIQHTFSRMLDLLDIIQELQEQRASTGDSDVTS